MSPPYIPTELISDIFDLTVEILVEEERNLPSHTPLSNRFLLSASLVNRAWNSIAAKALFKNSIITPASVDGYLAQVKAHGMEATLRSVRFGKASEGFAEGDDDAAFDLLVGSLSYLSNIELVAIQEVHLLNYDNAGGFGRKFMRRAPARLVVTETPGPNDEDPGSAAEWPSDLCYLLGNISHVHIATSRRFMAYFIFLESMGEKGHAHLRTCHFEGTSSGSQRQIFDLHKDKSPAGRTYVTSYPHLEHLATHLIVAHFLLLPGAQPNLTSLHILPNLAGSVDHRFESSREAKILDLIEHLPVLAKLRVPACWASDAVRDACDAKGVVLLS